MSVQPYGNNNNALFLTELPSLNDPVMLQQMTDPMVDPCGHSFDRATVEKLTKNGLFTCPLSRQVHARAVVVQNIALRNVAGELTHYSVNLHEELKERALKDAAQFYERNVQGLMEQCMERAMRNVSDQMSSSHEKLNDLNNQIKKLALEVTEAEEKLTKAEQERLALESKLKAREAYWAKTVADKDKEVTDLKSTGRTQAVIAALGGVVIGGAMSGAAMVASVLVRKGLMK